MPSNCSALRSQGPSCSQNHPLETHESPGQPARAYIRRGKFGLVAELKSGPFTRHTEQSIRQILERLRTVRIARVDEVRIVLGGEEIVPPAQTTSLPIDDLSDRRVRELGHGGDQGVPAHDGSDYGAASP